MSAPSGEKAAKKPPSANVAAHKAGLLFYCTYNLLAAQKSG